MKIVARGGTTFPFTMATSNSGAPLNAEPSRPDERESKDLQPKSYVDAVLEGALEGASERINGTSSPNNVNGTGGVSQDNRANGSTTGSGRGTSTLQVVHTDDDTVKTPGSSEIEGKYSSRAELAEQEKRPGVERQESKREYSATVRAKCVFINDVHCVNIYLGT